MAGLTILHGNPQTLARTGLKAVLTKGGGIKKIDEAATVGEVNEKLNKEKYDLVIIDHDRQCSFCQKDIKRIQETYPGTKFLILSSEHNQQEVIKILESGINGCVTRACSEREIINAVFAIANGEKFFCNKIIDVILQKHLYQDKASCPENCDPTSLSPREIEITCLITEKGLTNKEIAEELFLSIHTVHTHRKNIMKKLGIRSASELVRYAISTGIIGS